MSEAKTCRMTTPEYLRWCAAQGEVPTIDEMERTAKEFDALVAALKKAREFIVNGVEYGYISMPTSPDSATQTLPMIEAALALAPAGGA